MHAGKSMQGNINKRFFMVILFLEQF